MDAKHRYCLDLSLGMVVKIQYMNTRAIVIGLGASEPHDKSWRLNFLLPLLRNKCNSSTTLTRITGCHSYRGV